MTALTGHGPLGWAFPLVARGRLFCRSVQLVSSRRERELQTFAHFTTHHSPPTTHYCILPSPHSKAYTVSSIVSHHIRPACASPGNCAFQHIAVARDAAGDTTHGNPTVGGPSFTSQKICHCGTHSRLVYSLRVLLWVTSPRTASSLT